MAPLGRQQLSDESVEGVGDAVVDERASDPAAREDISANSTPPATVSACLAAATSSPCRAARGS
jgi:hypothetical protein